LAPFTGENAEADGEEASAGERTLEDLVDERREGSDS
jgi:hypothetical protein